jgi:hypothetical protein
MGKAVMFFIIFKTFPILFTNRNLNSYCFFLTNLPSITFYKKMNPSGDHLKKNLFIKALYTRLSSLTLRFLISSIQRNYIYIKNYIFISDTNLYTFSNSYINGSHQLCQKWHLRIQSNTTRI